MTILLLIIIFVLLVIIALLGSFLNLISKAIFNTIRVIIDFLKSFL